MTNKMTQAKGKIESVKRRSGLRRPKVDGWAEVAGIEDPVIYYKCSPLSPKAARSLARWLIRAADYIEAFRRK